MLIALIIVGGIVAVSIPGMVLAHIESRKKIEVNKLNLQKEILELEIKSKETEIHLLEEKNKELDRLIYKETKMIE
ncbi:MAG: hypothetical protein FWG77_02505 [Treponema sp.]|nr:hypothetical protein [Treponema sp.]